MKFMLIKNGILALIVSEFILNVGEANLTLLDLIIGIVVAFIIFCIADALMVYLINEYKDTRKKKNRGR